MKALLQLIRWKNLLFIALIMWLMEKMVAVPVLDRAMFGEQLPAWILYLLILSTVFIAAAGYVINDYFDVKIDLINRPDKLVVTRSISKQQAMFYHQVLTAVGVVIGLVLAVVLRSFTLGILYIFIPGLLWFYSSAYKRQFIVGNLIVALTSSLTPLMVAIANVAYLRLHFTEVLPYTDLQYYLYTYIGTFALFAFLTTLIREILKDLQDQEGDRELECHTLPIVLGNAWTKVVVLTLVVVTSLFAVWAVMRLHQIVGVEVNFSSAMFRYLLFGYLIPILCEIYLILTARFAADYRFAQQLMKFIMLLGTLFSVVFFVVY